MKNKKADFFVENLPFVIIIIVVLVIVSILIYTIYKGGLGFIANPPTKSLKI